MQPCLCVSSHVLDAPDGLDELGYALASPQRDLQTRGVAVLNHPHLKECTHKHMFTDALWHPQWPKKLRYITVFIKVVS